MSDTAYNIPAQKCNSNPQSHVNVTNSRGEIALEMQVFGVWLSKAVEHGTLGFLSRDAQLELQYAGYLLSDTAEDIRASDKGGV